MDESIAFRGDYIDNKFCLDTSGGRGWEQFSPADLKDLVIAPRSTLAHVDRSVLAARRAFLPWAKLGREKRAEYFGRLRNAFAQRAGALATIIARETGKPLWETKGEAAALINKIDITLNHSLRLVDDETVVDALPGVPGVTRFKPRGVMSVVGPFNFPAHLPNGHILPALATGNTVVFKPSDKTCATAQWMAECYQEAGFPPGVFNVIYGGVDVGQKVIAHEGVDGILFTGSYEVGLEIKRATLEQPHKILALEMGGKNATVVWHDADLDKAVYETLLGAFLSAGQRCSGTSRIILHPAIRETFLERFVWATRRIRIGHWRDPVFMGPLISEGSRKNFLAAQDLAAAEGAEALLRGQTNTEAPPGYYVTPSIHVVKHHDVSSPYQSREIFGPDVAVYSTDDFGEAMTITNGPGFGLAMSLFTKDRSLFDRALLEARVGVLNLNRTTNGASSRLPFGGMGKSGNDRPTAHFAVHSCTVPVASLEDATPLNLATLSPGIELPSKESLK